MKQLYNLLVVLGCWGRVAVVTAGCISGPKVENLGDNYFVFEREVSPPLCNNWNDYAICFDKLLDC